MSLYSIVQWHIERMEKRIDRLRRRVRRLEKLAEEKVRHMRKKNRDRAEVRTCLLAALTLI